MLKQIEPVAGLSCHQIAAHTKNALEFMVRNSGKLDLSSMFEDGRYARVHLVQKKGADAWLLFICCKDQNNPENNKNFIYETATSRFFACGSNKDSYELLKGNYRGFAEATVSDKLDFVVGNAFAVADIFGMALEWKFAHNDVGYINDLKISNSFTKEETELKIGIVRYRQVLE